MQRFYPLDSYSPTLLFKPKKPLVSSQNQPETAFQFSEQSLSIEKNRSQAKRKPGFQQPQSNKQPKKIATTDNLPVLLQRPKVVISLSALKNRQRLAELEQLKKEQVQLEKQEKQRAQLELQRKQRLQLALEQKQRAQLERQQKQKAQLEQQQKQITRLKEQINTLHQKMLQLMTELKQKNQTILKETLSEKIVNSDAVKQHVNNNLSTDSESKADSSKDYSQGGLLDKINTYLVYVAKDKISTTGHCHGITLLWLTMMYLELEPLFYSMIQKIIDCPDHKLLRISKTITTFLDWIDLGQNPKKYSNKQYTQRNVAGIIGGVQDFAAVDRDFTESQLRLELGKYALENNMICFAGKGQDKKTFEYIGHAIGVFIRKAKTGFYDYCVYDPNYKKNRHTIFNTSTQAATECWQRAFSGMVYHTTRTIEMDIVKPPCIKQQAVISHSITNVSKPTNSFYRLAFFNKNPSNLTPLQTSVTPTISRRLY
jgi:hypothetical protein